MLRSVSQRLTTLRTETRRDANASLVSRVSQRLNETLWMRRYDEFDSYGGHLGPLCVGLSRPALTGVSFDFLGKTRVGPHPVEGLDSLSAYLAALIVFPKGS